MCGIIERIKPRGESIYTLINSYLVMRLEWVLHYILIIVSVFLFMYAFDATGFLEYLIFILPISTTAIFFRLATNKSFPPLVRATAWGSVIPLAFASLWFVSFLLYHEFVDAFVDTGGLIVVVPPIFFLIIAVVGFIIGGVYEIYKMAHFNEGS